MVRNLKRHPEDFSERNYAKNIPSKLDLLQKELDVNRQEQTLLRERIQTVKDYLETLPKIDPEFGLIQAQIRMDQIELDELKFREEEILLQIQKR